MAKTQSVGSFLRDYRMRSGVSLEDVCSTLKCDGPDLLYSYETGRTPIPMGVIYQLANLYRIPPDQVLELFYKISEHESEVCTEVSNLKKLS